MNRSRERWAEIGMLAGILIAVAALTPEALRARLWIGDLPGPGLYPLIILCLIAGSSAVLLAGSLLRHGLQSGHGESVGAGSVLPLAVGVSLLAFPLLMPLFGFQVLGFAYALGLALVLLPAPTLTRIAFTALFAAILVASLHFLFARVFRVVLPVGSVTGF